VVAAKSGWAKNASTAASTVTGPRARRTPSPPGNPLDRRERVGFAPQPAARSPPQRAQALAKLAGNGVFPATGYIPGAHHR
jgi:hypothetical protein